MGRGAAATPSRSTALLLCVLLLQSRPAAADVLVPAALVVLASGVFFVPAILAIEAVVARRTLGTPVARSLILAIAANTASALAGVPLVAPLGAFGMRGNLVNAAKLLILLSVPLCPVSIWIEKRVALRLLRSSHTKEQCGRWAREANIASYAIVAGVSAALLIADSVFRKQGLYQ
jgi:hypothetical protein